MISHTSRRFRQAFDALPEAVQIQARQAYQLFIDNPRHPSLRFKPVHPSRPVYSARINRDYRAVGVLNGDTIVWFWIGAHSEYERIISRV